MCGSRACTDGKKWGDSMFKIESTTIKITRGDSAEFDISISDASGQPYELQEGDTVEFTVKENVYSNKALIHKTGTQVIITPEDTKNLSYKRYVYDIQVTLADGTVDTIIPPSTFEVLSEVTF